MKRIIFGALLVLMAFSGWNGFSVKDKDIVYKVEASRGGPNGFNEVVCKCDDVNRVYEATFNEPGNAKYETCCMSQLPKEVLKLVAECEKIISMHKNTSGEITSRRYRLNYQIQNAMNFKYEVRAIKLEEKEN